MTAPTQASALDRVFSAVDALQDELIEAVSDAVRIQSINPAYPGQDYEQTLGGESEMARFMDRIYAAAGCETERVAIAENRQNAVGRLRGSGGGRSLIFNGHMDVVPPGDPAKWESGDPFSGKVADGKIWGRGSTDMKSGLMAQAFAARAFKEAGVTLRGDLIVEGVVGEETGEHELGTTGLIRHGYRADAAVVAEPSNPPNPLGVAPVSTGIHWFSLTVRGKSTHAGMRAELIRAGGRGDAIGVSAIDKGFYIFQAVRQLEEQWGQTKSHPLFPAGHFSIHPGVVTGGPERILIPFFVSEFMTTEYCVWFPPDVDPESIKTEIEEHVHRAAQLDPWLREHPPELEWKLTIPAASTPVDHPILLAVQAAHERAAVDTRFAGPAPVQAFLAGEETPFLNAAGIPSVSYGPGDCSLAHGDDENVEIDEIITACRTYAALALDWCGSDDE